MPQTSVSRSTLIRRFPKQSGWLRKPSREPSRISTCQRRNSASPAGVGARRQKLSETQRGEIAVSDHLDESALEYHRHPSPGKISVVPTKSMTTQRDLALAYSPGVAVPCMAIAANPDQARSLTSRGNLVAVITNGTAVLGLGNIGALAAKPVMEGKACLFKKFADIDVFDIELNALETQAFIDAVAALEPTFGGINLEDIKAPECFEIEAGLKKRMNIPVFHDDQHGTAIISGAGLLNAAELAGKKLGQIKLVVSGAGAG